MASQRTKFTVGLFVASGVCIILMAIIWLGMSRYLEKGHFYATYFNESVQGLSKDTPVKYRGVPIGRVESIMVAPDSKLIEVVLKIESGQTLDHSYVAQLKDVGITGSMFVELDTKKKGEPDRSPDITFPSEYPIVATKPSELSRLLSEFGDVLNHIKAIDLQGISDKLKLTLDNVNLMIADADMKAVSEKVQLSLDHIDQMVVDADVKGISERIKSTLDGTDRLFDSKRWDRILVSVNAAVQSINGFIAKAGNTLDQVDKTLAGAEGVMADNKKNIRGAIEELREAMKNANILLEKGTSLMSGADDSLFQLRRQLSVSAQNLERATDNLNQFLELIADQPSQLVFGEPPAPRSVESEKKKK
ncbi:MAG: MCE family protein [Proteobacteria bacterium]|nr:MCE family protein [Desulfobacterales bacterium]MBL7173588.1 MCE family protein [Desulfobacteraceae bacterium]MBU0732803.1 MCE family protein [Pseudomonadota bacterium]MBU1904177.1 MCE family protein [Pseudomonadota bacterium]